MILSQSSFKIHSSDLSSLTYPGTHSHPGLQDESGHALEGIWHVGWHWLAHRLNSSFLEHLPPLVRSCKKIISKYYTRSKNMQIIECTASKKRIIFHWHTLIEFGSSFMSDIVFYCFQFLILSLWLTETERAMQ